MFRHILVPIDFSEPSKLALRLAVTLARATRGQITVLHVGTEPGAYVAGPEIPPLLVTQYEELAASERREAEKLAGEEIPPDVSWRVELRDGYPPATILAEAEASGCDLIVMGTHGRTGLGRVLLGSVTERVLHGAKVPVLVTR